MVIYGLVYDLNMFSYLKKNKNGKTNLACENSFILFGEKVFFFMVNCAQRAYQKIESKKIVLYKLQIFYREL